MKINTILQGNSLNLMSSLEDNSIDLVLTSPPYSSMKDYVDFKGIPPDEYVDWFLPYCKEIFRILKPTGSFILNINDKVEDRFRHPYVYELIHRLHQETDFKMYERLFWNKKKAIQNRSRFGDKVEYIFWFAKSKNFKVNMDEMRVPYQKSSINRMKYKLKKRHARVDGDENVGYKSWSPNLSGALPSTLIDISSEYRKVSKSHIAVFPEKLAEFFIKGSTNESDLVLDPFMGSGTTAVVAKRLKRNWIGMELTAEYIDEANIRISNS